MGTDTIDPVDGTESLKRKRQKGNNYLAWAGMTALLFANLFALIKFGTFLEIGWFLFAGWTGYETTSYAHFSKEDKKLKLGGTSE